MRNILISFLIIVCLVMALFFAYQGLKNNQVVTIEVEWSTASEMDTAGFNLYRSLTIDGTYEKINDNLIPASPDPLTGGSYSYIDHEVQPGMMYFYELEDVELNGSSNRSAPIEVKAKSGGWVEITTAIVMAGIAILGIFFLRVANNSKPK